jgi:hypothetical protein
MYNMTGGAMSDKTIQKMEKGGATAEQINFARQTQMSMDPRHVVHHRALIDQYNPGDPWRQPNNFVMHPMNYQFGPGQLSPQYIGGMLSTLPQPVVMSGPQFPIHPAISPYIVFNPYI